MGHEIINFLKAEDKRYVYINPWGNISKDCKEKTQFVFHIIETAKQGNKQLFELAAISEVDKDKTKEIKGYPKFNGFSYREIFDNLTKTEYGVSFVVKNFYLPNDKTRIFIETSCNNASIDCKEENGINKIYIKLIANPQHDITYASNGKKTISHIVAEDEKTDIKILNELLHSTYIKINNDYSINIDELPIEMPYAIITGRVSLELSMSNLIAYYLGRDTQLLKEFFNNCLNITPDKDENFEIVREREKNIDILLKSKNRIVVIENKIDSDINNQKIAINGEKESQLSKYYEYVENQYGDKDRKYFLLVPEYSKIDREYLKDFKNGDKYNIITYSHLYKTIKDFVYMKDENPTEEQKVLFEQFKISVHCLTLSKAQLQEQIAYIRLKQRLRSLESGKE